MAVRSTISIVGAGSLARVLAISLHRAGYRIQEIIVRDSTPSRRKAQLITKKCRAEVATIATTQLKADILWFCVSDDAIASVAQQLARRRNVDWHKKTVIHSSGALASDVLAPLKKRGASSVSAHPMNSFVLTSTPTMKNVPFALEGDQRAVREVKKIVGDLGAKSHTISNKNKVLYHAMGAFASPLYVSLIDLAVQVGKEAGVRDPLKVIYLILTQTTQNILKKGTTGSFSGPIRRSDVATLKKHLAVLKSISNASETYKALARNALERLPVKDRNAVKRLFK